MLDQDSVDLGWDWKKKKNRRFVLSESVGEIQLARVRERVKTCLTSGFIWSFFGNGNVDISATPFNLSPV